MGALLVVILAFVAMEPITYAVHRWVMHGPGRRIHVSHHRARAGRFEANDLYPVAFAAVVGAGLVVGFNVDGWGVLVPIGIGATVSAFAHLAMARTTIGITPRALGPLPETSTVTVKGEAVQVEAVQVAEVSGETVPGQETPLETSGDTEPAALDQSNEPDEPDEQHSA